MICKCYRAEKNFLGKVGVCWGTAERDACSCGGDKSKCDFYPSVREKEKKPITEYDRLIRKSPEELALWFNSYFTCPPKTTCPVDEASCEKCWLDWLKQEVTDDT
jgi:hypothetical protein